jgi:glycosyltransferase involved in cell wall biosynthesis
VLFRDDMRASTKSRYRAVERTLSNLVARYIAVSDSVARELITGYGLPPEQVTVVHNGVDPAPFLAPQDRRAARATLGLPNPDAAVVGIAARFSAQKGLRHLIAAVPELRAGLRADGRELVVVIGGSGPLESELREQAVAVEASGTVRWPGQVSNVPAFLSGLDVYVSPAETEALGIGLIEAAIAGVPTVATDVGGVPEVVIDGETGVLVRPHDSVALACAILGLLREPDRAKSLASAARERCLSEFAPDRVIERTLAVYAQVLAEQAERLSGDASDSIDAPGDLPAGEQEAGA